MLVGIIELHLKLADFTELVNFERHSQNRVGNSGVFPNGAELSFNSVNSPISKNLINH